MKEEYPMPTGNTVAGMERLINAVKEFSLKYYTHYNERLQEIQSSSIDENKKHELAKSLETMADGMFEDHVPHNLVAIRKAVKHVWRYPDELK